MQPKYANLMPKQEKRNASFVNYFNKVSYMKFFPKNATCVMYLIK